MESSQALVLVTRRDSCGIRPPRVQRCCHSGRGVSSCWPVRRVAGTGLAHRAGL